MYSAAASGWAGWALAHLEFGSSVNPITIRGADYTHHITASPPGFENPAAPLSTDGRCVFTRFLKASENTALFRVSILKLRSSLHQDKVATGIGLEHIGMYSRMEVCMYTFLFISFPSLFLPCS